MHYGYNGSKRRLDQLFVELENPEHHTEETSCTMYYTFYMYMDGCICQKKIYPNKITDIESCKTDNPKEF